MPFDVATHNNKIQRKITRNTMWLAVIDDRFAIFHWFFSGMKWPKMCSYILYADRFRRNLFMRSNTTHQKHHHVRSVIKRIFGCLTGFLSFFESFFFRSESRRRAEGGTGWWTWYWYFTICGNGQGSQRQTYFCFLNSIKWTHFTSHMSE